MASRLTAHRFLQSLLYRNGSAQNQIRALCTKNSSIDVTDKKGEGKSDVDSKQTSDKLEESTDKSEISAASDHSSTTSGKSENELPSTENIETKEFVEQSPEEQEHATKNSTIKNDKDIARNKLNALLMSLATTEPVPVEPSLKIELSKPKARKKSNKKKDVLNEELVKQEQEEYAKNKKKDVLNEELVKQEQEDYAKNIEIEPELIVATKEVAESLGGDVKTTESELLSTLRSHALETSEVNKPSNLSELFSGMKIESTGKGALKNEGDEESSFGKKPSRLRQSRERFTLDLFGAHPLGIFEAKKQGDYSTEESILPVWNAVHGRELQSAVSPPPANAFIEMIQWTNQGKLWQFPIDNEIGLEEEKKVGFHEHVFLDRHLQGWCPKRGPIRHFMELVCVALSKNPYLTVERKINHINWFKNYFEEKQDILKEIGAIEVKQ